MNGALVFDLVWHTAIHPRYERQKKAYADHLNRLVRDSGMGRTWESSLSGMMEVVEYVSHCILIEYGFATPWYTQERIDIYYPMHIRALNLASPYFRREDSVRN